jgi:hypothetical protein
MFRAELTFELPVSPKDAFAILSNPLKDPEWQASCKMTKLLTGPVGKGCTYEIVFVMVGKRLEFKGEVTEYEPGVYSQFRTTEGPISYVGAYTYTEKPDGTTGVYWTFDVEPGDYFGVMPISLLQKLLVSQVKKDVAKLTATLRQGARLGASS